MLLVVDHKGRYLQDKHRFESLNIELLKKYIDEDIKTMNFNELVNKGTDEEIILYTASQVELYKDYIEDVIYFHQDKKLVPGFEVLKSHENKFFQELYNRKYGIKTNIKSWLIGNLKDFEEIKDELPNKFVVKGKNGSSGLQVTICSSIEEGKAAILKYNQKIVEAYNEQTHEVYDLYPEDNKNNRQLVIQECVDIPGYDYRVVCMGDKFFVHKRIEDEEERRTSGLKIDRDMNCDVKDSLLDYSVEQFEKIDSPFAIFDIVDSNGKYHLIEWSGIHLSTIALKNSIRTFYKKDGKWIKDDHVDEYHKIMSNAINYYLEKK